MRLLLPKAQFQLPWYPTFPFRRNVGRDVNFLSVLKFCSTEDMSLESWYVDECSNMPLAAEKNPSERKAIQKTVILFSQQVMFTSLKKSLTSFYSASMNFSVSLRQGWMQLSGFSPSLPEGSVGLHECNWLLWVFVQARLSGQCQCEWRQLYRWGRIVASRDCLVVGNCFHEWMLVSEPTCEGPANGSFGQDFRFYVFDELAISRTCSQMLLPEDLLQS